MAIELEPGLAEAIAASTGAVHVEVRYANDQEAVRRGFACARKLLYAIPHPEEPDDPLPAAAKVIDGHHPSLWFDIADAEAYPGLIDTVIEALVRGLEAEGASGVLTVSDD